MLSINFWLKQTNLPGSYCFQFFLHCFVGGRYYCSLSLAHFSVCRFCCAIRGAVLPLVVVQRWTWLRHWCNTWCHRFTLVHVLASLVQDWCNTWCHRFTLVHVLASLVQDWCNIGCHRLTLVQKMASLLSSATCNSSVVP